MGQEPNPLTHSVSGAAFALTFSFRLTKLHEIARYQRLISLFLIYWMLHWDYSHSDPGFTTGCALLKCLKMPFCFSFQERSFFPHP